TGLFFALHPVFSAQFLPGMLTADTGALLLTALALLLAMPATVGRGTPCTPNCGSAVAAALAVWVNPAYGVVAVLTIAAMTLVASIRGANQLPVLRWSVVGAVIVFAGALIDRIPWAPAVSELRYVHPF